MAHCALDDLPGFRRRFRITPGPDSVCCDVEDDFHCMSVLIRHDGNAAVSVEPQMHRAPWTTCPGAVSKLQDTFGGTPLKQFSSRGDKSSNCTHLYDLAQLAANHAFDTHPTVYDILVSDHIEGKRWAQLRLGGAVLLSWVEAELSILEPDELAGTSLFSMGGWIGSLEPSLQEAARLLRWGNILASGRSIPMEEQSDATKIPPNCYTFQPERVQHAQRVGEVRNFSQGIEQPLAGIEIVL